MPRRSYNRALKPLPTRGEMLRALADLEDKAPARGEVGVTAEVLAWRLGVEGARRAGHGARGPHSWTGTMAAGIRIAPTLRSLALLGLVDRYLDERHRYRYSITRGGREALLLIEDSRK